MGSVGSLYLYSENCEKALESILVAYANKESTLNIDSTHNGHGKPLVIVDNKHLSVYDGSFGVFGEMYTDAEYFSCLTGCPIMAVSNVCNDFGSVFIVKGNDIIMEAVNLDNKWDSNIDAEKFVQIMDLPCTAHQINYLFGQEFNENYTLIDFLIEFEIMLNYPTVVFSVNDGRFSEILQYLELIKSTQNIDVYKKVMPFTLPYLP